MQKHPTRIKGTHCSKHLLAMPWQAKEVFVKAMVERQNSNKADKQRQRLGYFMRHADQRHPLRKEMFLNTLDLKERSVLNLVLNKKDESQCRSQKSSHYDRAAFQKANCSTFLDNAPSLPSQYYLSPLHIGMQRGYLNQPMRCTEHTQMCATKMRDCS